jgi:hypothetical protein
MNNLDAWLDQSIIKILEDKLPDDQYLHHCTIL